MRHNRSSFVGLYQHITQGGVACFRGIGKVGLSLLILGVWAGCGSGVKSASEAKASTPQFVPAEIPAILDSPEQQAGYLAQHYWKNFDFTDTFFLREPKVLESVFAQYIQVIESIPVDLGETSVRKTLEKAEADSAMYRCFIGMFEKYLYDPNAPTRNEDLYLAALRQITQSAKLTETEKQRPEYQQRMSLINRPDWPASDFTYTLANGSTGTLYGIKAQYVILFLNNPGCEACRAMIHAISQSHILAPRIASGEIKVLALYPDKDLKAWREHAALIPSNWINAYDATQTIAQEELYDLRAIPSVYLMDARRKVLLKDTTFPLLEAQFANAQGSETTPQ